MVARGFVRVFDSHEEAARAEADYWRKLTPEQRLDAVGECVRAYMRLRNEPEQGFRRVYRVLEQVANKRASRKPQDLVDLQELGEGDSE